MLFMPHYWQLSDVPAFSGFDLMAYCVYYGNTTYCKLKGGKPAFDSLQEVYQAMNDFPEATLWNQAVADFQTTKEYTALSAAVEELEAKKK